MNSMDKERTKSILFGFALVWGGIFYFVSPLEFVAFLIGLMLIGFGIVPEPEELPKVKAAPSKASKGKVIRRTIRQRKVIEE
ncbi:MAG TPA: hypothetical protein VLD37_03840 [Candidatus Bilamarchaeum sp.]|nr:hypothetical protein [Candidatus Bilamarchaeum sp.]